MDNEETTLNELRPEKPLVRSYMTAENLSEIRISVLRTTLKLLAEQLIKPDTGRPITTATLCRYANGTRPIPQWVAHQVLQLAEAARRYDARK